MLVTMKEILDHAKKGGYGVTAPNVQSEDTVRAVLEVAEEYHAPMIVDVNAFIHTDLPWFIHMIRDLAEKVSVPVAINLDHGKSYEDIMLAINSGFTSIMVDRSSLSYEENVEQTKEVVKMCRPLGISVEAELGHVGMGNNYAVDGVNNLTVPKEAADFINLRKAVRSGIQKVNLATELIVAGKEELEDFIKDPNFDKWKLIPAFKKGYKDRLAHYVELFDQAGKAWG